MQHDTKEVYSAIHLVKGSLLDASRTAWAGSIQPARKPVKFVAFLSQIPPSGPFFAGCSGL